MPPQMVKQLMWPSKKKYSNTPMPPNSNVLDAGPHQHPCMSACRQKPYRRATTMTWAYESLHCHTRPTNALLMASLPQMLINQLCCGPSCCRIGPNAAQEVCTTVGSQAFLWTIAFLFVTDDIDAEMVTVFCSTGKTLHTDLHCTRGPRQLGLSTRAPSKMRVMT